MGYVKEYNQKKKIKRLNVNVIIIFYMSSVCHY